MLLGTNVRDFSHVKNKKTIILIIWSSTDDIMPGCGEVTQSGWGLWGRAGRGQVVRSGLAPWWSLCTLYLPHARWSCRRRLRSLLLWACVQCLTSIVRAQLVNYFPLFVDISETVQVMPSNLLWSGESPTKGLYIIFFRQSDETDLHSRSQLRLKVDKFVTCTIIVTSRTIF